MVRFENSINIVAALGLALGAVFGMAGTFVVQPDIQALLWAIDGTGLVMAAALLTLKYLRMGHDVLAAGFLVFAIAEAVLMSGTAAGQTASVPAFAAGTVDHFCTRTSCPSEAGSQVRILSGAPEAP